MSFPVITAVSNVLAHAPGMVRYGSRPLRDIGGNDAVLDRIAPRLRSYAEAMAYPPNQAYIGNLDPDALAGRSRPWFEQGIADASPQGPFGEIIPETELLCLLKGVDRSRLVHLLPEFLETARQAAAPGSPLTEREIAALEPTPRKQVDTSLSSGEAIPLWEGERLAGCFLRGHEEDEALTAPVLLENLLCKATGVLALHRLLEKVSGQTPPEDIPFVIAGSEEAVGDRYQRGGGNMAKAIGESAGLTEASGMDVKAFCASTLYGLLTAAAYVKSGLFEKVAVVSGGSLAKLGMKYRAHLDKGMPILEDVLAGVALLVECPNGGRDPVVRMDAVGLHRISAGSSQQAIFQALAMTPLEKAGYTIRDIDKFVTEMHNPEVTEPAAGGNVPEGNYKMIGALAAMRGEIPREEISGFASRHGIPGYAPTQGHIASAVCYLAHACQGIREGRFRRALFMAKGSLFLGRMTDLSDGVSFLVEAGPSGE